MTEVAKAEKAAEAFFRGEERNSIALAFCEVGAVFILFLLLIKYLETTWFGVYQLYLVGWDYFAHLMMFAFPLVTMRLAGRSWSGLGLSRDQFFDPEVRRISRLAAGELFVIWMVMLLVNYFTEGGAPSLILPPRHFAELLAVPELASNLIGWGITIVFVTVFCGFGEEVFFRGYMQGRLNRALGRPFRLFGIKFGWGLVIVSMVFGLGHGFAYFNPFDTDLAFRPEWGAAAVTGVEGFILGLVYERTGGVMAPAVIHAAIGLFFSAIVF